MRVDRLPGNFVRRTKIRATAPPIGNEPPAHRLAARSFIAISRSCCYSTKWLHSHRSKSRLIGRVSYRNFLGAFRRGGHYHTQAWDMGQHSLGGLGVMLGSTNTGAMRRAQNHGQLSRPCVRLRRPEAWFKKAPRHRVSGSRLAGHRLSCSSLI
jgi:hypothetical protein